MSVFYFCLATVSSTSVVLRVYNTGKYTRLAIGLYFVQLMAGYKTPVAVEISCAITVQQYENYGNLMNIFVYRNHVDYYTLSFTIPGECCPSTQIYRSGVMK